LGLQVTMNDTALMRRHEDAEELRRETKDLGCRELSRRSQWVTLQCSLVVRSLRPTSALLERLPLEERHHEVRAPAFVVVVVDGHDAGVTNGVRYVAFAQEALANVGVGREALVKDLDGDALLVSVRGGVDGRHSSDSKELIESPAVPQDGADSR